jgi:hypothetical protein
LIQTNFSLTHTYPSSLHGPYTAPSLNRINHISLLKSYGPAGLQPRPLHSISNPSRSKCSILKWVNTKRFPRRLRTQLVNDSNRTCQLRGFDCLCCGQWCVCDACVGWESGPMRRFWRCRTVEESCVGAVGVSGELHEGCVVGLFCLGWVYDPAGLARMLLNFNAVILTLNLTTKKLICFFLITPVVPLL